MKKSTLYLLLYIAQIFTLQNCSPKNSQEAKGNISPPITPKAVMTVAEAKAFLKTSEPKREKEITVIASCWGTIESLGGEVLLFIGDKNFAPKEKIIQPTEMTIFLSALKEKMQIALGQYQLMK